MRCENEYEVKEMSDVKSSAPQLVRPALVAAVPSYRRKLLHSQHHSVIHSRIEDTSSCSLSRALRAQTFPVGGISEGDMHR